MNDDWEPYEEPISEAKGKEKKQDKKQEKKQEPEKQAKKSTEDREEAKSSDEDREEAKSSDEDREEAKSSDEDREEFVHELNRAIRESFTTLKDAGKRFEEFNEAVAHTFFMFGSDTPLGRMLYSSLPLSAPEIRAAVLEAPELKGDEEYDMKAPVTKMLRLAVWWWLDAMSDSEQNQGKFAYGLASRLVGHRHFEKFVYEEMVDLPKERLCDWEVTQSELKREEDPLLSAYSILLRHELARRTWGAVKDPKTEGLRGVSRETLENAREAVKTILKIRNSKIADRTAKHFAKTMCVRDFIKDPRVFQDDEDDEDYDRAGMEWDHYVEMKAKEGVVVKSKREYSEMVETRMLDGYTAAGDVEGRLDAAIAKFVIRTAMREAYFDKTHPTDENEQPSREDVPEIVCGNPDEAPTDDEREDRVSDSEVSDSEKMEEEEEAWYHWNDPTVRLVD
jgi:hypothetical protein